MKRIIIRFDEFFKYSCGPFFGRFGLRVETEVELHKQPRKLDVLVVRTDNHPISNELAFFKRYWRAYNLISFKSPADNKHQKNDIVDTLSYLSGYINLEKKADFKNTTITVIANHTPMKFFQEIGAAARQISPGYYVLELNLFQIHYIDVNMLPVSSLDTAFLRQFSSSEKLQEFLGESSSQKMVDELKEFVYIRLLGFENDSLRRQYMPSTYEADITDLVKPYLERSRLEGERTGIRKGRIEGKLEGKIEAKLETAKKMIADSVPIATVCKYTKLTKKQLQEAGLI